MKPLVSVQNVSKNYGQNRILHDVNFELCSGQVLGILGPNGAGKSSLINALIGGHRYEGEILINGYHPIKQHAKLMMQLAYISDVDVLPGWMKVSQLLSYTAGVHPSFDINKARAMLSLTSIKLSSTIKQLSKGMKVQLHLAILIATDTNVLILDEPTLGLDLLYRDTFYRHLLEWFHDGERTLIIASHELAEIEHLLTDVLFLKKGETIFQDSMENINDGYFILEAPTTYSHAIAALSPLGKEDGLGSVKWLLNSKHLAQVESFGRVYHAGLTDIFIALQKEAK